LWQLDEGKVYSETTTGAYYENQAREFFDETIAVDMSSLYARFLRRLPNGGHILDAGCGSGRDVRAFLDRGYEVYAIDASPRLAELASSYCGLSVQVLRLQDVRWQNSFDGIWACASLLHVPVLELPGVLIRIADALKPRGVLYASFKYGQGERDHNGRRFTDLDETGLADLLREVKGLKELETWVTTDLRPGREAESWLNTLLVASPPPCPST
jgi:SAM-dependent methyltransferase